MIVDTHVHVWEMPPVAPIGPTAPNWTSLPDEPGTAEELLADMDANGVTHTVVVQTSWSTWDNGYIADSAARYPDRFTAHGLIDPLDPDNARQVRYWMDERGLAGFRFHPMYYPDVEILTMGANAPMWSTLSSLGAVVQLHMRPQHARQVNEIARRHPDVTILLDHMSYPDVEKDPDLIEYQAILDLAAHPSVHVKVSDVHSRSRQPFPYEDLHETIRRLLDAFGPERLLWGTGYPGHHRARHGWPSLADELRLIREGLPFLSESDRALVLGGNAARIWRLE